MRHRAETRQPRATGIDEYPVEGFPINIGREVKISNPEEARNAARLIRAAAESGDIHKPEYRYKLEAKAKALSDYLATYRSAQEIEDDLAAEAEKEQVIVAIRARMIDYSSSVEDRYQAAVEFQTIMGVPVEKIVSPAEFKKYDENNRREFLRNNTKKEQEPVQQAETEGLRDGVRVKTGLREARDKLKEEARTTNTSHSATASNAGSDWERVYGETSRKKPSEGFLAGVKSWFEKMFGNSEKK